jgi:hypothetical protein
MIKSNTRLQLDRITDRVETGQGIEFVYDEPMGSMKRSGG